MAEDKLVFHYWPIKARNWWPLIVASYGDVSFEWVRTKDEDEWYKEKTPFGQLPVLQIGSYYLPQSLAIGRYFAGYVH
jgi:glutathione S-transferase